MFWFGDVTLFLQRVSKRIGKCTRLGELVVLLFSIPCFKTSQFFFKLACSIQQRELVYLGRKCVLLGGEDFSLEFDHLLTGNPSIMGIYRRLGELEGRLQRRDCSTHGEIRSDISKPLPCDFLTEIALVACQLWKESLC